jgi:hypothetical protein
MPVASDARRRAAGVGLARDGLDGSSDAAMNPGSRPIAALMARIERPDRASTSRRLARNSSSVGSTSPLSRPRGSVPSSQWLLLTSYCSNVTSCQASFATQAPGPGSACFGGLGPSAGSGNRQDRARVLMRLQSREPWRPDADVDLTAWTRSRSGR